MARVFLGGWLVMAGWAAAALAGEEAAIVGIWDAVDRHVSLGSLYQPVHGVRKRTSVLHLAQEGERLVGYAVCPFHHQIVNQERWKDGRTDFRSVKFEGGKLTLEWDIGEWRLDAGPIAVEDRRIENKTSIRVEAALRGERLIGTWQMFLADGTEVFRGEWEATRAKSADQTRPVDDREAARNEAARAEEAARFAGHWIGTDHHVVMASIFQTTFGARTRETPLWLRYERGQWSGYAGNADSAAPQPDGRWKDARTDFSSVTLRDGRLVLEHDINEWARGAGPLAVDSGRLANHGKVRIEAQLESNRLIGNWRMFTADGVEVYRGEWEATRAKAGADEKQPAPVNPPPPVAYDEVTGSINHCPGTRWRRVRGRARALNAQTLEFSDGTRIELDLTVPAPEQMALRGERNGGRQIALACRAAVAALRWPA